jgi:hypothetical protein
MSLYGNYLHEFAILRKMLKALASEGHRTADPENETQKQGPTTLPPDGTPLTAYYNPPIMFTNPIWHRLGAFARLPPAFPRIVVPMRGTPDRRFLHARSV